MTDTASPPRTGRFAPSPTGPLHFGSLVAALGSYLHARSRGGLWRLRIDDLDRPREVPGAADEILRTLDAYGLHWDGPVLYQSRRDAAYAAALQQLHRNGAVFPCGCTRQDIALARAARGGGPAYPGTCRGGLPPGRRARAWRVRTEGERIRFEDWLQGRCRYDLEHESGDFVVRRADGLFAYQLAVVVDDAAQGVTEVVRGADLLDSTPRQILLQRLLGLPTPKYLHLPVATTAGHEKLSKQTGAPPLDRARPVETLSQALAFLRQPVPGERPAGPEALLAWAAARWDPSRLPRCRAIALGEAAPIAR